MFTLKRPVAAHSHKRFDYGKYLQLRYGDNERGDGTSGLVDCWGLIRMIYRQELQIDLPAYSEIGTRDILNVLRRMRTDAAKLWYRVEHTAVFDIVAMTSEYGRRVAHVGILIDPHNMMHSDIGVGVCIQTIDHPTVRTRIVGFYRHGSRM